MAAHCRLRQLHHVAELGDRQLASFQDREHAHTNRIGEDCKLIDNWRRIIHPYSRMKGYIMRQAYVKRAFQGAVFGSEVPCAFASLSILTPVMTGGPSGIVTSNVPLEG